MIFPTFSPPTTDTMLDQPPGLRFLILQTDCHCGSSLHATTTNDTASSAAGDDGASDDEDVLPLGSSSDTATALPQSSSWHQAWRDFLAEAPLICDLVLVEDDDLLHGDATSSSGSHRHDTKLGGGGQLRGVSLLPQRMLRGCGRSNVLSFDVDVGEGSGGGGVQVGASSCHLVHGSHRLPLVVQSPTWIWDAASDPSAIATATVDLDATAARAEFLVHWEQLQTYAQETVPSALPDVTWNADTSTGADVDAAGFRSSTNTTPSCPTAVASSFSTSSSSVSQHDDPATSLWLHTIQASLERELQFTHRALAILGMLLISLLAALLWDVWTTASSTAAPPRGHRQHHCKTTTATTAAKMVPASSSSPPATTRNLRPPPSTIRCTAPSGEGHGNVSPLSLDPALGGSDSGGLVPTPQPAWSPYRKLKEDWDLRVQAKRRVADAAVGQVPAQAQPHVEGTSDRGASNPAPPPRPTRRIIRRIPSPTPPVPLPPLPPRSPQGYRTPPRPYQATSTSTDPRGAAPSPAVVTPLPYEAGSSFLDEFWGD